MEIVILKEDFSHMIKKSDAWLVYTKSRKVYVCNKEGVEFKENIIKLTLHKRRESK